MVSTNSPVDWERASSVGSRLARGGPVIPRAEAEAAVAELRAVSPVAEQHVRELTGLGEGLPLLEAEVVDRSGWVVSAISGLRSLTDGVISAEESPLLPVLAGTSGAQAGAVLALLSGRVLGQFDPFAPGGGKLLLVAPNVVAAERAMDVDPSDFRMWVCLHESTHRLQFTAVDWLAEYFSEQVRGLIGGLEETANAGPGRLLEIGRDAVGALRSGTLQGGAIGLFELLQTPEQRAVLHRLLAVSTLLEGHADYVMDAVGPTVVPSVERIRNRFTARRSGGGLFDRVLRAALGIDAKLRQYAEGAAFTRAVIEEVGMAGFNAVWTSPETLPTREEIADPVAWRKRVHG
ncbi:zinc-dependent metalloprotease [Sciscionella marina]|uniref:zinc-dependent metalloprotease n=1 Tax=Sciscionella marina TaxID=508770 RepID=UPI000365F905